MSVFQKERHNRSYVYFQIYENRKRRVTYLGPGDDISTWKNAERLFLEYQHERLNDFYSKIPGEFRDELRVKERRRMIPIAIKLGKLSTSRSDTELLERQFLDAVRDGKIEIKEVELDKILKSPSDLQKILNVFQDRPFDKAEVGLDKDSNRVNVRLWL